MKISEIVTEKRKKRKKRKNSKKVFSYGVGIYAPWGIYGYDNSSETSSFPEVSFDAGNFSGGDSGGGFGGDAS